MITKTRIALRLIEILVIWLGLTGGLTGTASAATCDWLGVNTSWTNVNNWSCAHVPTSADDVNIGATAKHPIINTNIGNVYANNFTIASGGVLEVNSGVRFDLYANGDMINNGTIMTTDGVDSNYFGFNGINFGSQFINNGVIDIFAGQLNAYPVEGATQTGTFSGRYGTIGILSYSGTVQTFSASSVININRIFFSGQFDTYIYGRVNQSWPSSTFNIDASDVTIDTTQLLLLGALGVSGGGTLTIRMNSGNGLGSFSIPSGGILTGVGAISEYLVNAGTVSPGTSPGVITVSGYYTQESTGILMVELGGTIPGIGYDQLVVTGATTLGGTLEVSLTNGFTPELGQSFTIMTYGSHTSEFATIHLPILPNGLGWEIAYGETDVILTVEEDLGSELYLPLVMR